MAAPQKMMASQLSRMSTSQCWRWRMMTFSSGVSSDSA